MRGAGERVGCRGLPGCSIMRAFLPFANIGVLRAGHAQPLYLLTPAGRFALRATAHRADAPLRRAHGFAALANIGVLCAGRAQPLYLLTPSGRFGPLAQVPTGHTLPFGAPPGRFGPLAQQPTGLTLPSGAPKTCAAAQNASVSSGRRSQETRVASIRWGAGGRPVRNARGGASRRGADGVTGAAEFGRRDEPGCRDANTGTECEALARVASRGRREANGGVRTAGRAGTS